MEEGVRLLVDSAAAIGESGLEPRACSVWSTSTGLSLKTDLAISSPETLISTHDFDQIALAMTAASDTLRSLLGELEEESPAFRWLSDTILASLVSFARSMGVKALLLYRWLEDEPGARCVVAGSVDVKPVAGLAIDIDRHDSAFALLLQSDPLKESEVQLVRTAPVDRNLFQEIFNRVSLYDRSLNILRRSVSAILFKTWEKFGKPPIGTGSAGRLLILNETTTIEDCFVPLVQQGWRVEKLTLASPHYEPSTLPTAVAPVLAGVGESVSQALREPVGHARFAEAVSAVVVQRLEKVLENFPSAVVHYEAAAKEIDDRTRQGNTIVLSNGLFSAENRLFSAVLKPTDIKTVCVDHGSAIGVPLHASQDLSITYNFCDAFLNQNRKTSKLLSDAAPRPGFRAQSIGAHRDLLQPRAVGIGRYLAKRRLSIANGQRCAIYASSLESNNVHLGYGAGRDLDLVEVQTGVLEAAASFKGIFVVKPYPAQRYPDPSFLTSTPAAGNLVRAPHGELQNIRFAADLIVVDATASTLGVVLGAGCPVIFINNKRARIAASAITEMKDALFFVDANKDGWVDELRTFLKQPREMLLKKWDRMERDRLEFVDKRIASVDQISSRNIPSALAEFMHG